MIEVFAKVSEATKLLMTSGFTPSRVAGALAQVGTALGVDRLYIFEDEMHPVRGRLSVVRYGWAAPGVASLLESPAMKQLSLRELAPLWADVLAAGEPVSCLASNAPLRMKPLLADHKTQSMLLAPIQQGKEKWGFVGMDDCRRARLWTAEETILLKSLAGGLGTALRHRQMRSSLSQTRTQLAELVLLGGSR